MTQHKRLVVIGFDGVLHRYDTPWTDAATISDGPTPGAMAFLKQLVEDDRFNVGLVSSRLATDEGCHAVEHWLAGHLRAAFGTSEGQAIKDEIVFYEKRPPAFLTLDDRGWCFDGTWPSLVEMTAFRPWNKRPAADLETKMMLAQSRHGHVSIDGIKAHGFLRAVKISRKRDDAEWYDILREVARRAYEAGCGVPEYHEADCQDEVTAIIDDVLGRKEAPAEYDAEAVRIASEGIPVRIYPPAVATD